VGQNQAGPVGEDTQGRRGSGISSSAIVTKLLVELRRLDNPESRLILGIIVVEDVFLALYLAALQPVLEGGGSWTHAVAQFGQAFAFLIALIARFGAKWVGRLVKSSDDELLTVPFVGLVIAVSGVAEELESRTPSEPSWWDSSSPARISGPGWRSWFCLSGTPLRPPSSLPSD
jgi:hypothetical protein